MTVTATWKSTGSSGGSSQGGNSQGGNSQGGNSQGGNSQGGNSQGGNSQGGNSQGSGSPGGGSEDYNSQGSSSQDGNSQGDKLQNDNSQDKNSQGSEGSKKKITNNDSQVYVDIDYDDDVPYAQFNLFLDVTEDMWHYNDVMYVYDNSLMKGTEQFLFSPDMAITRGMVVTVLYRLQGAPDADALEMPFDDVYEDDYYYDSIKWGAEYGVILGFGDGTYRPDIIITREQMAAIFYRYAELNGFTFDRVRDYEGFDDDELIEEYARPAIAFLYEAEIINGKPHNMYEPQGDATRAEFAAVIHRFVESLSVV